LNRRALLAVALSLGLALGFAPAFSQVAPGSPSGLASVSLDHYYYITTYGFGVLNDSFTFSNNGTSTLQIPTLQVGLPASIASRSSGFSLSPSTGFSLSQSTSNGITIVNIAPDQPTLNAGANVTVALKAFLNGILNYSSSGYSGSAPSLVLLSPSLNLNVTEMRSAIVLPVGGTFATTPTGFTAPPATAVTAVYTLNQTGVQPQASTRYVNFTETNQSAFTPISINSLIRTIVPAANGSPMVEDQFSIHNLASYNIAQVHLRFLGSPGSVTVLPDTEPPLLNPQQLQVGGGQVSFASTSIGAPLSANGNISLTLSYPVPSSAIAVAGGSVKVTVPSAPFIGAFVPDYVVQLAPVKGVAAVGPASIHNKAVTPLTTGSVVLGYSVSVGWAADQAVPAAALLFSVAFAMFAIQRPSAREKGEEEEKESLETSDVLKAFEDKTGLETQYMEKLSSATKGSIGKTEFDRMRNDLNDLRARAIQRFNELRRDLGAGRQFDVLTRVGEAEKEEDRAFRDLLNLYLQFHGSRMNDETFKRLQNNYRKRVESAINRLSDLLDEVRTEEK
jgi:hypothetical protein